MPVISPNTNTRAEGYFRLEWKLAVDRSHLMADDAPFLFPIVVGDVNDATARVPDKFREVQWTRLRLDETPAELAARVARLLAGEAVAGLGEAGPGSPTPATTRHRTKEKSGFEKWWWLIFPVFGMTMALIQTLKLAGRVAKLLSREAVAGLGEAGPGSPTPATTRHRTKEKTGFEKWWWLIFPVIGMTMALIQTLKLAGRVAKLLSREAVAGLGEAGPGSPTPATTRHRTKEKSGFEKWWWLIFPVIGMTMALIQTLKLAGRVAKLLSREAVAGLGEAGPGSPTPATTRHRTKEKTGFEKWWWLIFPVFGMTMALIQTLKREPGHPARPAAGGDHAVLWGEPLPLHTLENVGSAELHVISVELKDAAARVNL